MSEHCKGQSNIKAARDAAQQKRDNMPGQQMTESEAEVEAIRGSRWDELAERCEPSPEAKQDAALDNAIAALGQGQKGTARQFLKSAIDTATAKLREEKEALFTQLQKHIKLSNYRERHGRELEQQLAKARTELDMQNSETCYARLAAVTSAFLVLKNDKTITGGARKLIEKECDMLADGTSGGHLIRELINLRKQLAHQQPSGKSCGCKFIDGILQKCGQPDCFFQPNAPTADVEKIRTEILEMTDVEATTLKLAELFAQARAPLVKALRHCRKTIIALQPYGEVWTAHIAAIDAALSK